MGLALACALVGPAWAEDRTYDGTGNNPIDGSIGAAGTPLIRFGYPAVYPGDGTGSTMLTDLDRANPRDISNAVAAQSGGVPSARFLSDYLWAWGQFVDHDIGLSTGSDGAGVNGSAPIAINDPLDPLYVAPGPSSIPFTRSNYVLDQANRRQQVNEITTFIDASNVYGSDATRAAALRTNGGIGAKLLTGAGNLLPFNTGGLDNANGGPTPDNQLFLAGDIRANENVLLTSMHTLFLREHNRLVDIIAVQQPGLNDEQQYQLARKLVGAEMQIITYNEFLPAFLGTGVAVPKTEDYNYQSNVPASITQAFAHGAYRFGHSTVSPDLQLVNDDGTSAGSHDLGNAFFNPGILSGDPSQVDLLLKGASTQVSQEIDSLVVDALRNALFGPPGNGGMDLASLNIQRGRDHGLPDYNASRGFYGLSSYAAFSEITSDSALQQQLSNIYGADIDNIDLWVGALAEDHLPGTSVGELMHEVISNQFQRLRDGDRLFYLSDDLGLYTGGILNLDIASIIDLDNLLLSDIIAANTSITNIRSNVFFATLLGDANNDGQVTGADLIAVQQNFGNIGVDTGLLLGDANDDGQVTGADLISVQQNFGNVQAPGSAPVPEPATLAILLAAAMLAARRRTR